MHNTASPTSQTAYKPKEPVMVTLPLHEIQGIRDRLAKLRDQHPSIRQLFSQVAGLYQRLAASKTASNR